jgi:C-terminal peptidase prc
MMKHTMKQIRITIVALVAALLAGCGALPIPFAAPPTPAPTRAPTATPAAPTRTTSPQRTAAPRPTADPTAAAQPRPTAAPTLPTVPPLTPTATLEPISQTEREQIFAGVWELVRDRYVYTDYRGVDWEAVRAEFAPRVAAAADADEFYSLMKEMIDRLGDEHSRYDTPQDVADERARFAGDLNYVGIGALIRETDEGVLLLRIARNSPAERAGLQPFDLVTHVDGILVTDAELIGPGGPISRVRGPEGIAVRLTVRSSTGVRDVDVVRGVIPSDAFPSVEANRLPGSDIGFLLIDTFSLNDLDTLVRDAIGELAAGGPLDGLVIDVRGNSGGRVDLLLETLALFIDGGSIGTTSGRSRTSELIIPSGQTIPALDGVPVVVLTSDGTVSAGEMFAAGMQALGRAVVVGTPSAGNTENLLPHNFDDGSRLWLAELVYLLPDGTPIEGRGVLPDRVVDVEFWRYATEDDPQVLAALEELRGSMAGRGG